MLYVQLYRAVLSGSSICVMSTDICIHYIKYKTEEYQISKDVFCTPEKGKDTYTCGDAFSYQHQ